MTSAFGSGPPRVGIVCDLLEERWFSMDLVADMLLDRLQSEHAGEVSAERIRPEFAGRFRRLPALGGTRRASNADRLLHRFWDYPRFLRAQDRRCDVYHVMDHSYAQLVHELPADRTVVVCHDLDAFRSIVDPARDPRSQAYRVMARRILSGLRKAAYVVCVSEATRAELLAHGLASPERTGVIPNGVHPACSPERQPAADREAERLLARHPDIAYAPENTIDLLHVGSAIPRKRIDILLRVFAAVQRDWPGPPRTVRLIRVGGPFTPAQRELARQLGVEDSILVLPFLDRALLAAVYRRAALVLLPSESEGFGLPLVESLACGTPVVASDLAALREVGGRAADYCAPESVDIWRQTVADLLRERAERPDLWAARRLQGVRQAERFSWSEYAHQVVTIYQNLLKCNLKNNSRFSGQKPTRILSEMTFSNTSGDL